MNINIIVTGAGRGIGRYIAAKAAGHFSERGITPDITICSKTAAELDETAELIKAAGGKAHPVVCDIADPQGRAALLETASKNGAVDILINNAGISYIGVLQDMSAEDIRRILAVNLEAPVALSAAVIPGMLSSEKSPRIINISSVWGITGASCEAVYSASKGGLNSFTRALAKELAPSRIPVNAIACGYIDTAMNSHLSDEEKQAVTESIPAGRAGTPAEIAGMVCMLLDAPDYMTGQVISVDGGWC